MGKGDVASRAGGASASSGGTSGGRGGVGTTGGEPSSRLSKKPQKTPATWNTCLFFSIMAVIYTQLSAMIGTGVPINCKQPLCLIVSYLHRLLVPLQHYVETIQRLPAWQTMFVLLGHGNPIKVASVDSIRGVTSDFVHVVRARRNMETPDQFYGIQGDEKREYICYTRGRLCTTMWLEVQPHGVPGDTQKWP